jgi:hypothetical protein
MDMLTSHRYVPLNRVSLNAYRTAIVAISRIYNENSFRK